MLKVFLKSVYSLFCTNLAFFHLATNINKDNLPRLKM